MHLGQFSFPSPGRFTRQDLTRQDGALDELAIYAFFGRTGVLTGSLWMGPQLTGQLEVLSLFAFEWEIETMAEPLYAGTTKTVRLNDLTFIVSDPDMPLLPVTDLSVGESILVAIKSMTGGQVFGPVAATNDSEGNDWWAVLTMPAPGQYLIEVSIAKDNATELFYATILTYSPFWASDGA